MSKMKDRNNHPHHFTYKLVTSVISKILSIVFSIDYITISIRKEKKYTEEQYFKALEKRFKKLKTMREEDCDPPIWAELFEFRSTFQILDTTMNVMTGPLDEIGNIDSIIHIFEPSKQCLEYVENELNGMKEIKKFWTCKLEPTFDISLKKRLYRKWLRRLIKYAMYFRYARRSFTHGDEKSETYYINFRSSIKQSRVYEKKVDREGKKRKSVRFEVPMKRMKLNNQEIISPTDFIKHGPKVLNEISLYKVSPIALKTSRLDFYTDHYWSSEFESTLKKKGFHEAVRWAQSCNECPKKCLVLETQNCPLSDFDESDSGKAKLLAINGCDFARKVVNFRQRFCDPIPEWNQLKNMMLQAFEDWAK